MTIKEKESVCLTNLGTDRVSKYSQCYCWQVPGVASLNVAISKHLIL